MKNRLEKILNKNEHKFENWIKKINDYDLNVDEKLYATSETLGEISELFFSYGNFKDKFDNSQMYIHFYGPELIIKSEKTETNYYFGVNEKELYLNTYLKYPKNIKFMGDEFYSEFLSLETLGNFQVIDHENYSGSFLNKYENVIKTKKSNIFKLLRNYFIGMAEQEEHLIIGSLEINWSYEIDFREVITNSCIAFKKLYKLNYDLWKISDLKSKK